MFNDMIELDDDEKNEEDKVPLSLAMKYKFVTPWTSMIVVKKKERKALPQQQRKQQEKHSDSDVNIHDKLKSKKMRWSAPECTDEESASEESESEEEASDDSCHAKKRKKSVKVRSRQSPTANDILSKFPDGYQQSPQIPMGMNMSPMGMGMGMSMMGGMNMNQMMGGGVTKSGPLRQISEKEKEAQTLFGASSNAAPRKSRRRKKKMVARKDAPRHRKQPPSITNMTSSSSQQTTRQSDPFYISDDFMGAALSSIASNRPRITGISGMDNMPKEQRRRSEVKQAQEVERKRKAYELKMVSDRKKREKVDAERRRKVIKETIAADKQRRKRPKAVRDSSASMDLLSDLWQPEQPVSEQQTNAAGRFSTFAADDLLGDILGAPAAAESAKTVTTSLNAGPRVAVNDNMSDLFGDIFGDLSSENVVKKKENMKQDKVVEFEAYNKDGIVIVFHLKAVLREKGVCEVLAVIKNMNEEVVITEFVMMVAVPKYMKLKMKPANGTRLEVLAANSIEHRFEITNTMHGSKQWVLKVKVRYNASGRYVTDVATVNLPDNLF